MKRKREGRAGDSPTVVLNFGVDGPTLREFVRRRDFVQGLIGPLGSGKTFAAIQKILAYAHNLAPDANNLRDSRWCIARNSFPDLNAATIPDVREIVDKINPNGWNMTAPISWTHVYARADGTTVRVELMFRSFDGDQDVKKARGMQLTGAWVDEAGEFPKSNLDMLIGRVKRYPQKAKYRGTDRRPGFHVLLTSNAVPRDHWLAEAALGPPQPGWWIGVQPGGVVKVGNSWVANPNAENLSNLPDNYYTDQCANKKESWIRQNLANEFVTHVDGRPVHPDFNEAIHVAPTQYVPGIPLYMGCDYGRTPSAVFAQRTREGTWRVLSELPCFNMGADRFGQLVADHINEVYPGAAFAAMTGDPAGSDAGQTSDETAAQMMAKAGLNVLPAVTNDPEIRRAALDRHLTALVGGVPSILVDPGCTLLIRGLAGEYCFRRLQVVGQERYQDQPVKDKTSHTVEALHYLLLGAGEGEALFDDIDEDLTGQESWALPDYYYE